MTSKFRKGIRNPSKAYSYLRDKYGYTALHYRLMKWWYMKRYDHTEAYRQVMQYRINHFGPGHAVGGFGHGIGELQFDFLCDKGLKPSDSLLDVGCGTLRGGQYFLDYLEMGNYTGMDISAEAIEAGVERNEQLVSDKNPAFVVNDDLKFEDDGLASSYDYAIAQSVFTHLPAEQIDECLGNIGKAVEGTFYATFFDHPKDDPKNFGYDPSTLIDMGEMYGHSVNLISEEEFPHPRDQRMLEIKIGK